MWPAGWVSASARPTSVKRASVFIISPLFCVGLFRRWWRWPAPGRGRRSFRELPFAVELEHEQHGREIDLIVGRAHHIGHAAQTAHERDVLLAAGFIRDGRSHAGAPGFGFEQLLSLVGGVGAEGTVVDHLE